MKERVREGETEDEPIQELEPVKDAVLTSQIPDDSFSRKLKVSELVISVLLSLALTLI